MFCYIFSLTHHFLSYFLSSATPLEKKNEESLSDSCYPHPPPPAFKKFLVTCLTLTTWFRGHVSLEHFDRNSEMLCVLVLILTKYMVQCGMLFVNNFVFIIFKTCKSSYKKTYIIEHWKPSYKSHQNNMEIRQFSRLAAKYTRAQTVFMIAADLYLFW